MSSDKINNRSFHVIRGLLSAVENGKSDRTDHRMSQGGIRVVGKGSWKKREVGKF